MSTVKEMKLVEERAGLITTKRFFAWKIFDERNPLPKGN